jgi:Spy/CpxP family protein refolding chaperone
MKTLHFSVLATALLFISSSAMAQPEPGMPPHGNGPRHEMMMPMLQKLNLTPDQKNKMQSIRKEKQTQTESLKNEIDAKRDAFHALMKSDAAEAEIRKAHAALQALHQKMADLNFENLMAIRAILTPEQRKEMHSHMGEQRGRKGPMKGPNGQLQGQ